MKVDDSRKYLYYAECIEEGRMPQLSLSLQGESEIAYWTINEALLSLTRFNNSHQFSLGTWQGGTKWKWQSCKLVFKEKVKCELSFILKGESNYHLL